MSALSKHTLFFFELLKREIKNRYQQSVIGFFWLFINPAILLIIYYFIFQKIFAIKFELPSEQSFISFIAIGLWPWVAFSEGLSNATMSMQKNLDLIKKISIPKSVLVLVDVVSAFIIHGIGLACVMLVLTVFLHESFHFTLLPVFFVFYFLFLCFCFGLSLILSSLQVFLRDVSQALPPLLMIWFYLTPILYPAGFIPDVIKKWLELNPVSPFIEGFKTLLLTGQLPAVVVLFKMLIMVVIMMGLGFFVFRRLSPRFEDMY